MARKLTKAGLPLTRNLAKPWRPQRFDPKTGDIQWSDAMRLGAYGQKVNSTGCVGIFGSAYIRTKTYGPRGGKRREGKPKKRCHLISTHDLLHLQDVAIKKYIDIRFELIRVKVVEEFTEKSLLSVALNNAFDKITLHLKQVVNADQWAWICDKQRQVEDSTWGNLEKNGVKRLDLRGLAKRVNFIASHL